MINNDLAIDRLQDLILTSVNLTEWQKEQIKEAIRLLGGEIMIPKFRAYDTKNKVMVTNFHRSHMKIETGKVLYQLNTTNENEIKAIASYNTFDDYIYRYSHDLELMQSTGLIDRNGVDIFEGDVVVGQQHLTTDSSTPFEIKGLVRYSKRNTMFYLDEKSFGHDKFMHSLGSSIYQYEVIGNIYENPELLEVEG
ncbi:hypothetical protein AUF12_08605 [Enterococcus avium]|jgi:uncharacterized phage protein (TIGR01671 family)|uniref:YopX family protein n=1 Tax=Enterococcus avium TaxID=33945 RepID=UPI000C99C13B|nr:YopX family protein [Enterococcus avium]PNE50552.1 hypothetical protein AUF12_08605 [Enterococcus avium]